jgi:hypothetical protein
MSQQAVTGEATSASAQLRDAANSEFWNMVRRVNRARRRTKAPKPTQQAAPLRYSRAQKLALAEELARLQGRDLESPDGRTHIEGLMRLKGDVLQTRFEELLAEWVVVPFEFRLKGSNTPTWLISDEEWDQLWTEREQAQERARLDRVEYLRQQEEALTAEKKPSWWRV